VPSTFTSSQQLLYKSEIKILVFLSDISLIEIANHLGSSSRSRGINLVILILSRAKD
jgi:hypothetical protein